MDVLYVPTWLSQIEHLWERPKVDALLRALAELGRLIMFDRRGSGMSDPLDERADARGADGRRQGRARRRRLRATRRCSRSWRAARWPACSPPPTRPRRARSILYAAWARTLRSEDIPWAEPAGGARRGSMRVPGRHVGHGQRARRARAERGRRPRVPRLVRQARAPRREPRPDPQIIQQLIGEYDVRSVLPSIRVPTLVMHRRDDSLIDPRHAQYIAERIPERQAGELARLRQPDRSPATATRCSTRSRSSSPAPRRGRDARPGAGHGDVHRHRRLDRAARPSWATARWRELLERHDDAGAPPARPLQRPRGQDDRRRLPGHLRRPGAGDPLRARRSPTTVGALGVEIRAGLHTGECEVRGRRRGRHGGAHRRPRRRAGGPGRGARLQHGEGPRRRLRASSSPTAASTSSRACPASGALFAVAV